MSSLKPLTLFERRNLNTVEKKLLLLDFENLMWYHLQGKSEFIGRALCKPVVKLSNEKYESPKFPPSLDWWDIHRGPDRAGELLAAFELLQVCIFFFQEKLNFSVPKPYMCSR